jgi:hypothetical protein
LTNLTMNPGLLEFSFLPFSVLSVLLVRHLWLHWPTQANTAPEAGRKNNA